MSCDVWAFCLSTVWCTGRRKRRRMILNSNNPVATLFSLSYSGAFSEALNGRVAEPCLFPHWTVRPSQAVSPCGVARHKNTFKFIWRKTTTKGTKTNGNLIGKRDGGRGPLSWTAAWGASSSRKSWEHKLSRKTPFHSREFVVSSNQAGPWITSKLISVTAVLSRWRRNCGTA